MKSLIDLRLSILLAMGLGLLIASAMYSVYDKISAISFIVGYCIFLFSIGTSFFIWQMIVSKKQVALGTILIVSKYLTFCLFMFFLVKQNWPGSLWLIGGFVSSKIIVLAGYLIFVKKNQDQAN